MNLNMLLATIPTYDTETDKKEEEEITDLGKIFKDLE